MNTKIKAIILSIEIQCTLQEAWKAWTSREGITGFLAPDCKIGVNPDEPYEMYFIPGNQAGDRGGEGNKILAVEPYELFSFTWNAPPQFTHVRPQRTSVCLRFDQLEENRTRINLIHTGWGNSTEWQQVYKYFQQAWGEIVLPRLKSYLEGEPVVW